MVLISRKFAMLLQEYNIINDNELEIYIYSFYSIISYIVESLMLLFIGALLKEYIKALIFVLVFPSLRKHTGGYHANTKVRCVVLSIVLFNIYILVSKLIINNLEIYYFCLYCINIIYLVVIYMISPVSTSQKELSQEVIIRNRNISIIQGYVLFLFSFAISGIQRDIVTSLLIIQLEVLILMIVLKIRRIMYEKDGV